jgi:hypothetical protein
MRLAMIIDAQRLAVEQRLINRLGVGLMAEGVELVRITPEGLHREALDEGERRIALAQRIEAPMRVMPWLRAARIRRLAMALEAAPPDVLYLVGADTWALGLDLAAVLDRPALIDVYSPAIAQAAPKPRTSAHIAGYVAPCEGIAQHAIARLGNDLVHMVPMGVSANRRDRSVWGNGERVHSMAVLGSASDVNAYLALFEGLADVFAHHGSLEVFVELRGAREHEIWRNAERLNLLGRMSIIGSGAEHRPLLLRCDLLALPEGRGELRSLMLEAMAGEIPVVAANDPSLEMLRDGDTARIIPNAAGRQWSTALHELLETPETARALGARARDLVIARHRSSNQVAGLVALIERVGRRSYAFNPSDA